jgi:hypothetical protein
MFHHAAPRRLVRERLLELPFYEVAGTVNFTAESACISRVAAAQKRKDFESRISAAY